MEDIAGLFMNEKDLEKREDDNTREGTCQWTTSIICLFPSTGIRVSDLNAWLYMVGGNLNSGPYACTVSTLPTQPLLALEELILRAK